ncbi:MAG: hypothetical protein WAX77_06375 [Methylococcaceae bacterium]
MDYWNLDYEDQLFKTAYEKYRYHFSTGEIKPIFAPYSEVYPWSNMSFELYNYYLFLKISHQPIANEINRLYYRLAQISAWDKTLKDYPISEEKHLLLLEFVKPITDSAIELPFVLRSRFIYFLSHLSHQANLLTNNDWDETKLPEDKNIDFKIMQRMSKNWGGYNKFISYFNQINNDEFIDTTKNYRNKNQHRLPPNLEEGYSTFINRVNEEYIKYVIIPEQPVKLINVQMQLIKQFNIAMECYKKYDEVICNQLITVFGSKDEAMKKFISPFGSFDLC